MTNQAVVPGGADSGWYPLSKAGTTNVVVPVNEIWLLTSARLRYVSDATVATRYYRMRVRDAAAADAQASIVLMGGSSAASLDKQYQFGVSLPGGDIISATVPSGGYLVVTGLRVIEVSVDGGAPAGDNWTAAFHAWKVRAAR